MGIVVDGLLKIAIESVISKAFEDGGSAILSNFKNDQKSLDKFKSEMEEWEYKFEKDHDNTIVARGDFYEYIKNKKEIEKIIEYVLSENEGFTNEILDEEEFLGKLVNDILHYFKRKEIKLNPMDVSAIRAFYNGVMQLSKSFILRDLIDSKSIKLDFKLNQIYYLISLICQNTGEILTVFKNYAKNFSENQEIDYFILLKNLKEAFLDERKNNPSFALIDFDKSIMPEISLDSKNLIAKDRNDKSASIEDFLQLSFKRTKEHIFLYGMGGIGKTVSLLSVDYKNPVIYIPLRNVINNEKSICNYIKEQTLHSNEEDYNSLLNYCELSWDEKSHLILIIDGLNEVDNMLRKSILRELQTVWSKKRNIQMIITSRNDMSYDLDVGSLCCLKTNLLSMETIIKFLNTNSVEVPLKADKIWGVIDTPLMLVLYVKSEYLRKRIKNDAILLRKNVNSGAIIWNFLQSEVYRFQKSCNKNLFDGIIAAEFITPYIAYQMQYNSKFIITQKEFRQYINSAYNLYQTCKEEDTLSSYMYSLIENEEGGNEINKNSLYYILTNKLCLFKETGDYVQLIHQHFRDCFAAIHIFQTAEMYDEVPDEWKSPFSYDVSEFLADLIKTENIFDFDVNTWDRIWNKKYKLNNPEKIFISQMLQLYKLCFGSDLSKVDFSNLDLSDISLNGYKFSNESKRHFVNTKLTNKTFIGDGHRKSITAVSWSPSNKDYFSASHDCTVRMWNYELKQGMLLNDQNQFHQHYIRCAQWNPTDEDIFVTAGDDRYVVIWKRSTQNTEWLTESIGICSDWIVGISWSNDGKFILCGERNGNIELFDKYRKIREYSGGHTNYVRHISWSKNSGDLFATGSDDGQVCIWNKNQKNPIKILKSRNDAKQQITSIKWLNEDKILVISNQSSLYCLDITKIFTFNDNVIFFEDKDVVLKSKSANNISFVAINSNGDNDYYSIFYEDGIDIFRGYLTAADTYDFVSISNKSTKPYNLNKIICADWNKTCNKLICGSRGGDLCEIEVDISEEYMDRVSLYIISNKNNNAVRCTNWSHCNKFIVAGYDDCRVRIWDIKNKSCIKVLDGPKDSVKCVVWAPDDNYIAAGSDDGNIYIWSSFTEGEYKKIKNHSAPVNSILWLKNGYIVSASDDNSIIKFNTLTEEKFPPLIKHTKRIYSLATFLDENYIISAGNDKLLCLWDIEKYECVQSIKSGHSEPIRCVACSSNDIIVSCSNDCSWITRKIDTDNIQILEEYQKKGNAHEDFIYSIAVSNDNRYVITGSTDNTVGFWDIDTQDLICYGKEHDFFVWAVSASHRLNCDSYIATASSDGTIKIWNTNNLEKNEIQSDVSLEVISNIDIVGCDFSEAIFDTQELKKLVKSNGGVV